MKRFITASKDPSKGVFWIIDGELLAFPFYESETSGVAKSGDTYDHKTLWNSIRPKGINKPFDYYPRGRVDIDNNNKSIIYMNPNIDISFVPKIKVEFGLRDDPAVRYDHSNHYKCYLDDGYVEHK